MANSMTSVFSKKHADLIDVSTPHVPEDLSNSLGWIEKESRFKTVLKTTTSIPIYSSLTPDSNELVDNVIGWKNYTDIKAVDNDLSTAYSTTIHIGNELVYTNVFIGELNDSVKGVVEAKIGSYFTKGNWSGGSYSMWVYVDVSNDGTTWSTIDSFTSPENTESIHTTRSIVNNYFKFVRVRAETKISDGSGAYADHYINVYEIMVV
ncbi:hypothetical protein J7L13_03280 [bacterium]|nr:hypothetical protein [bacterium]